ncbi:HK97-gp10 family putative phage morphogenesis protein [Acetobacter oryzifermentans]|uniref:Uncharacterized protein n=1 Tax=Acetobacter oryzifermentans TaxID=1633874 RepID=A0ABM6AI76_9PROT|nr:hypothetical protein [Acetobacter oryzifermentans]ANA13383.1 hypothetical protein WG31_04670 [Acetobacter oryzifermentans]
MAREFTEQGFLDYLASAPVRLEAQLKTAMKHEASHLQKEAREEVGHYQEAAGPFPAWSPLADSTMDDRIRKGFTPDDPGLRTGAMRDSYKASVEGNKIVLGSTSNAAQWFEEGTIKQPPRPVIGPAIFRNTETITRHLTESISAAMAGHITALESDVDD